jgi:DNA-binding CsgD family transcriptional regulator
MIFAGLALGMVIAYPILESTPHDAIEDYGDVAIDVIFMGVMLYTFIIGLSRFGKLHTPARERLLRKFLMVFGSFLPGLLVDTLLSEFFSIPIQIFPILYCGCSIVFSHHFLECYTAQHIHAPSPVPSKTDVGMLMSRESENTTFPLSKPSMPESFEDTLFMEYDISPREQEVVRLIAQGCSNQQIAETLFISVNTVKAHVKKVYVKFGVKSRYELISLLKDRG